MTMLEKGSADTGAAPSWRGSKWLALVELLIVAAIFYADYRKLIPVSKTPELVVLAWVSMRLRGLGWRDVGVRRYKSWPITLAIGVALGTALETFQLLVTQPILSKLMHRQPDLELFGMLRGNLKLTALFIVLSWVLAGLGEELFWRAYLMNRFADLFGRNKTGWTLSLLVVSGVFGFAHDYQGITGIIEESIAGLFLGLMYLAAKRNLWPSIVAHGMADTIDMVLLFFGKMPGA